MKPHDPLSDDDLRTLSALRDLIADNDPDLPAWLRARKPAHRLEFLRSALGDAERSGLVPRNVARLMDPP